MSYLTAIDPMSILRCMDYRTILDQWPSIPTLARRLGIKTIDTVWKWHSRNSIPPGWWAPLVDLAERDGIELTLEDLAKIRSKRK